MAAQLVQPQPASSPKTSAYRDGGYARIPERPLYSNQATNTFNGGQAKKATNSVRSTGRLAPSANQLPANNNAQSFDKDALSPSQQTTTKKLRLPTGITKAPTFREAANKVAERNPALGKAVEIAADPLKVLLDRVLVFAWVDGLAGILTSEMDFGISLIFAAIGFVYIHIHWIASELGVPHFSKLGGEWELVPEEVAHIPEVIFLVFCDILLGVIAICSIVLIYYAVCHATLAGYAICKFYEWWYGSPAPAP